jgi:hypothetical protein
MKKILFFSVLLLASLAARSQQRNADPLLNILMDPPALQTGTNGLLRLDVINAGSDGILANTLEIVVGMSTNGEILGLAPGSSSAWTIDALSTGSNNAITLHNTGLGLGPDELQVILLTVRGNIVSGASVITGGIAYIPVNNPALGGAPNTFQGNLLSSNDNSTTSLIVTAGPPLPIDLKSFSGTMANCQASLSWVANASKPYENFTLERSNDGRSFEALQSFPASSTNPTYAYSVKQQESRSFYRVKMVDRGGNATYSNTLSLTADCMQADAGLSPNPTRSSIRLSGLSSGGAVRVYNQFGAIVIENPGSAASGTVDLSALPAGIYRVSWETEAGVVTRSVTKL